MLASTALLVALGAILGLVEGAVIPPLPVPGVRIGLANIAVVLALALLGPGPALRVGVGRVLIVALAGGTLGGPAFAMALVGALAAWGVMAALARFAPGVSPLGWSVAGAAAHVARPARRGRGPCSGPRRPCSWRPCPSRSHSCAGSPSGTPPISCSPAFPSSNVAVGK